MSAGGDIVGSPSAQLYSNWLFRQGKLGENTGQYTRQPAWWIRFDQFQQGVAALGGGNVTLTAGGKIENLSASSATQARMAATTPDPLRLVKTGGGSVRVETGGDLTGGQYYADRGELTLKVGGNIGSGQNVNGNPLYTILALGDARARVQAQGQVDIHAVLNPHLVIQSSGRGTIFNLNASGPPSSNNPSWSLFSTYSEASGVDLQSLRGSVTLHNQTEATVLASAYGTPLNLRANSYTTELLSILPPSLSAVAFQGDILMNSGTPAAVLSPGARGDLTLLAAGSIRIQSTLVMSDRDPALIPSPATPGVKPTQFPISTVSAAERELVHATRPVHLGDPKPARVYAVAGNIEGEFDKLTLDLSKSVRLQAGQDIQDVGVLAQHVNPKT